MKKLATTFVIFFLLSGIACSDEDCDFVICDSGPFFGDLNVLLTINDENPEVEVVIYEGKIEGKDTLFHEFISESNWVYSLESNRYYSGTAFYKDGIRDILVINGKNLPTKSDDCDCEYGQTKRLNLRLAK